MPRSNRARRRGRTRTPGGAAPGSGLGPPLLGGTAGAVSYAGQQWSFRAVRGNASGRSYVCPGCQQELPALTPHTVAWPQDAMQGVDNRRHWHTTCWAARDRRRPGGSFA